MYTVIEAPTFQQNAANIWTDSERLEFISYLSANPLEGDVIPKTGGMRKIRWQAGNKGKRGGVRVIYYNLLENGYIIAVTIYSKSRKTNISSKEIQRLDKGEK